METAKQHGPAIVALGVLTQAEYAALKPSDRVTIDADLAELVKRYGEAWVRDGRDRLRGELAFVYGI